MLSTVALVLQLVNVNTQTAVVCEDVEFLVDIAATMNEPVEPDESWQVVTSLLGDGRCVLLEEDTLVELKNVPGLPEWLVRVRVYGESKDWWSLKDAIWEESGRGSNDSFRRETVNGPMPFVCAELGHMLGVMERWRSVSRGEGSTSSVAVYMAERELEGECMMLDKGMEISVTKEYDVASQLIRIRVAGQAKDLWAIRPMILGE